MNETNMNNMSEGVGEYPLMSYYRGNMSARYDIASKLIRAIKSNGNARDMVESVVVYDIDSVVNDSVYTQPFMLYVLSVIAHDAGIDVEDVIGYNGQSHLYMHNTLCDTDRTLSMIYRIIAVSWLRDDMMSIFSKFDKVSGGAYYTLKYLLGYFKDMSKIDYGEITSIATSNKSNPIDVMISLFMVNKSSADGMVSGVRDYILNQDLNESLLYRSTVFNGSPDMTKHIVHRAVLGTNSPLLESLTPSFGDEVTFISNEAYDMWAALELESGGIDADSLARVNHVFESLGGTNKNLSWDESVDEMVESGDFHHIVYMYENFLRDAWNKGVNIAKDMFAKVSQSIKNSLDSAWSQTKSVFIKAYGRFKDDLSMYGMESYSSSDALGKDLREFVTSHESRGDIFDKIINFIVTKSYSIEGTIDGEKISSILGASKKWMSDYGVRNYGNNIGLGLYVLARPFYKNLNTGSDGELWAAAYIDLLRIAVDKFCDCDIDIAKMAYAAASIQVSLSGKGNELLEYVGVIHDLLGRDYRWWTGGSIFDMAKKRRYPYKPDNSFQAVKLSIKNTVADRRTFVDGIEDRMSHSFMIYDYITYILNNEGEASLITTAMTGDEPTNIVDDENSYNKFFETFDMVSEMVVSHTALVQPMNESITGEKSGVESRFNDFCNENNYPSKSIDGGNNAHSMLLMLEGITSVDPSYIMESNAGFNAIVPGMKGVSSHNMGIVSMMCENLSSNTLHLEVTGDLSRVYEFYTTDLLESFIGDLAKKTGNYIGKLKNRVVKGVRGFVDNAAGYMSSILKSAQNRISDLSKRAYHWSKSTIRRLGIKNSYMMLTDYDMSSVDELEASVTKFTKIFHKHRSKLVKIWKLIQSEVFTNLPGGVYKLWERQCVDGIHYSGLITPANIVHRLGCLYYQMFTNKLEHVDSLVQILDKKLFMKYGIFDIGEIIHSSGVMMLSMKDSGNNKNGYRLRHYMFTLSVELYLDTQFYGDASKLGVDIMFDAEDDTFVNIAENACDFVASGNFEYAYSNCLEAAMYLRSKPDSDADILNDVIRIVYLMCVSGVDKIIEKIKPEGMDLYGASEKSDIVNGVKNTISELGIEKLNDAVISVFEVMSAKYDYDVLSVCGKKNNAKFWLFACISDIVKQTGYTCNDIFDEFAEIYIDDDMGDYHPHRQKQKDADIISTRIKNDKDSSVLIKKFVDVWGCTPIQLYSYIYVNEVDIDDSSSVMVISLSNNQTPTSSTDNTYGNHRGFNESLREIFEEIKLNYIANGVLYEHSGFETPLGFVMAAHLTGNVTDEVYTGTGDLSLSKFMESGDVKTIVALANGENINESIGGYFLNKGRNAMGRLGEKIAGVFKSLPISKLTTRIENVRDTLLSSSVPYGYVVNGESVFTTNARKLKSRGVHDDKKFCVLEMIWNHTEYFGYEYLDDSTKPLCLDFMRVVSWAVTDGYVGSYIDDSTTEWDPKKAYESIIEICRNNITNWRQIRPSVKTYIDDIIKSVELT